MPLAALAVHELRYLLAFGGQAGSEAAAQGHGYLDSLTPILVCLCALGFGSFAWRLASAWQSGRGDDGQMPPLWRLWLIAAAGLLAIYMGQETLEGFLATGHPSGIAGVFGSGGWWSVPAALAVGGLLAILIRGARGAINLVARAARTRTPQRRRIDRRSPKPSPVLLAALDPVPRLLAPRGPPPQPIS